MRRSRSLGALAALALVFAGCARPPSVWLPGPASAQRVRLPNGWFLSPSGAQVGVGELPLNMDVTPDGRYAIVTDNGTGKQDVCVIDVAAWRVVQTIPVRASWLGIRFVDQGRRFLVSGGNDNRVFAYSFRDGAAALEDSIVLAPPWPDRKIWVAGLDVDERSGRLFACGRQSDSLYVVDLASKRLIRGIALPGTPYTCLVSPRGNGVYVSLWGASAVAFLDPDRLAITGTVAVGEHPNDMVESPDGGRLFVANGNQNTVSVIDVATRKVTETICSALDPKAPPGSTPNSVALNAAGDRLYIANADNNYVAVMDVSHPGDSRPLGCIPVGWYPTCVRVAPGRGDILVANGKGGGSQANPRGPVPGTHVEGVQYIGSLFHGTVSRIPPPTPQELDTYTTRVFADVPYWERKGVVPAALEKNPIPARAGDPSPIRHVFYVIKENRTYDQVLGDLPQGNGDAALCLFPEAITPNHHALARQFVLLDNFYADAEVSADGHNWSMGAYATDYVEKSWPTVYGDRGGEYEYEGGYPIVYPANGYLWDNCLRQGVSYRDYGEFGESGATPADSTTATMESLKGHMDPRYRAWDLGTSDTSRVHEWAREFDALEREGRVPQLEILKLPNDHTEGSKAGSLTPRAFVAQNDLALGMIVDRISHSSVWKESAIFVVEDDAQNGPDHVDAHRTVALVVSPYTKHGFVDSKLYSTSGMVRTIELILGLPPLSQFDASARPMFNSFAPAADLAPYRVRPATVDLAETNRKSAAGERRSEEMDFTREDAAPEQELNEIVWKSIRGEDSVMPPPVRGAFARIRAGGD